MACGKNAVILINKGPGITSFDCLGKVKRLVNKKTGHCGTLDKFAQGLLIVLCGSYTHLVPAFMGLDKTYEAVIEFGKSTDTLDPEGAVIETAPVPSLEVVSSCVSSLVGSLKQIPPAYSAIHINGKRSYQMARSMKEEGQLSELLPSRPIFIHEASIISYSAPYLRVRLHVSKGTYVRAYARDLGHLCGSCAYVKELYRTAIGPFSVDEAIDFDDCEALGNVGSGFDFVKRIPGTVCVEVTDAEAFRISNGNVPKSALLRVGEHTELGEPGELGELGELGAIGEPVFAVFMNNGSPVSIYSLKEKKIICQVGGQE